MDQKSFHFYGNVEGSIVGKNVQHANIHNASDNEQTQKLQQIIDEINKNYPDYLLKIAKKEMDPKEKNEILDALQQIKEQINQPQLNPDKIRKPGKTLLENSSYVASICGAVFALLQLLKI